MQSVTVIGIDPGSQRTGWGVVREVSGVLQLVDCGVVRTASAGKEFSDRLARNYHELSGVLARLKPEEAAIEQVFTAKNAASALKLGQARGVARAPGAASPSAIMNRPLSKNPLWERAGQRRSRWPLWCNACSTSKTPTGRWIPPTRWQWPYAT